MIKRFSIRYSNEYDLYTIQNFSREINCPLLFTFKLENSVLNYNNDKIDY